MTRPYTSAD